MSTKSNLERRAARKMKTNKAKTVIKTGCGGCRKKRRARKDIK